MDVQRQTIRGGVKLALLCAACAVPGCRAIHSDFAESSPSSVGTVRSLPAASDAPEYPRRLKTDPHAPIERLPSIHDVAQRHGAIRLVSALQPVEVDQDDTPPRSRIDLVAPAKDTKKGDADVPAPDRSALEVPERIVGESEYRIDLGNALALGGANSLQIELARERVVEAHANYLAARAKWLPSLRFGIGYNKHDGKLQNTPGTVIEAGRNSLFVGGGAGLGDAPLAGGASGPSRLAVNLSLADAAFEPLVACQLTQAEQAAEDAATNNALLEIAVAYFDLVDAHARAGNMRRGFEAATKMVDQVIAFEKQGFSSKTEINRAKAEGAHWAQSLEDARRESVARSTRLARLLRLDAQLVLMPVEEQSVPIEFVDAQAPVPTLIAQGLASRPELEQFEAMTDASIWRVNQEHWRPWLPNVQVGASSGAFGGGPSTQFRSASGRSDIDLLAVWELRNLGVGNRAMRCRRESQLRQAELRFEMARDVVATEIAAAVNDVRSYKRQINAASRSVAAAEQSYRLNDRRIRAGEGLPIEVIQSIRARADAQNAYSKAIGDYNRAQYRLLRALGRPPQYGPPN